MAKELPYFRFTVQDWQNGKITLESYELQGLFISICGYYWINDCELTLKNLIKKYRNDEKLISELIDLEIIKHEKRHDKIEIVFLNIQYDLLSEKRKTRQSAGSRGGKATAMLKQKDSYKDKDNNKDKDKDNNKDNLVKFSFRNSLECLGAKNDLINDWLLVRKNKKATNSETAFNLLKSEFESSGLEINEILKICVLNSWSGFKKDWLKNISTSKNNQNNGSKFDNIVKSVNNAHDEIRAKYSTNNG